MKTKILLFVIICLPIFVWGQKEVILQDTSDVVSVTPPEFTGIENVNLRVNDVQSDAFRDYLTKNIKYSEEAAKCHKQGTAVVQFVVTADGELSDFEVLNSVCPVIDEELIRVLKTTDGMWKPGLNNEKPVNMEKEVSMMFVADPKHKSAPYEYFTKLAGNYCIKANTLFLEKHNLKKALKNYNQIITYLPYDASTLLVRGLCRYEMGDREGAISDWKRVNEIGTYDADWCIESLADLEGYDEMQTVLNNK